MEKSGLPRRVQNIQSRSGALKTSVQTDAQKKSTKLKNCVPVERLQDKNSCSDPNIDSTTECENFSFDCSNHGDVLSNTSTDLAANTTNHASNYVWLKKGRRSNVLQSDRVLRRRPVSNSEVVQNCSGKVIIQDMNLKTKTKRMINTTAAKTEGINLAKHSHSKSDAHLDAKYSVKKPTEINFSKWLKSDMHAQPCTISLFKTDTERLATCSQNAGNRSAEKTSVTLKEYSMKIKIKKRRFESLKKRVPVAKRKKTIVTDHSDVNAERDSDNAIIQNIKMKNGCRSVVDADRPFSSSDLLSQQFDADNDDGLTHTEQDTLNTDEDSNHTEPFSVGDIEDSYCEENEPSCHRLFTYHTEYELQSLDDSFTLDTDLGEYRDKTPRSSTYKTYSKKRLSQQTCDSSCQTDDSLRVQSENFVTGEVLSSTLYSDAVQDEDYIEDLSLVVDAERSREAICDMNTWSHSLPGEGMHTEDVEQEVHDPATDEPGHREENITCNQIAEYEADTGTSLESSHHSCRSQHSSPDPSVSQEALPGEDNSTSPVKTSRQQSSKRRLHFRAPVLKRRKQHCLTDITCKNMRSLRTRTFNGSQLRGSSGWEESLRQCPAQTHILQVGCDPKSSKTKKNEKGICSPVDRKNRKKRGKDVELTFDSGENKSTKQPSCDSKSDSTTKKKRTNILVLENDRQLKSVVEIEPNYGKLVWARLAGEKWWPGMIIKGSQVYLQGDNENMSWIFWFGDHKVSQISHKHIIPFEEGFSYKFSKRVKKPAIEALQECCRRNNWPPDLESEEALLKFAAAEFKFSNESQWNWTFEPLPDEPIPEYILSRLKEIGEEVRSRAAKKSPSVETQDTDIAIDAIKSGERKITDVCITCLELDESVVCQHPMFEGGLCQQCKEFLMETSYAFGEDGLHSYCTICGYGGKLFICDSQKCCRVYCFNCVDDFCGPEISANIQASKSWACFLCSPYESATHGLLQPKANWEEEMVSFFHTGCRIERPSLEYFKEKRPIRVLSLFDGIGTCKLALDQLGIAVDEYYSSEVDKDALMVTRANHGDSIVQIGDVQLLTSKSQLPKIGPVDLLIGGSPCNDFSLANPDRKGFGGSGVLFFDFFRVLKYLQITHRDRHLFWLYENVASMKTEYMARISRFLDCQPALWDSKYFTAQHRARYFWGNIPGLYSTPEISTRLHKSVSLDSSLESNCNRQAVIPKLRTVTTRTNSLKFGKKDEYFPVQMDGVDDGIWIPELERVFGFPSHYTDVGNLPTTRRQRLIGRAWCLPVIAHILAPLAEYFTVQEQS